MAELTPEHGRIFRITHTRNVPLILRNGLYSRNSGRTDPAFVQIGMKDLIDKRALHPVPVPPGGLLSDYVPFYFTPWSIMMRNITQGLSGVEKHAFDDLAIIVSSIERLQQTRTPFIFTNAHAYMAEADYFTDPADLDRIDWDLLRRRDFKKNPEDPGKLGRYQAECLVRFHVPPTALLGVGCYDGGSAQRLASVAAQHNPVVPVRAVPNWFF